MKYSSEIVKAICAHVALGVSQKDAAALEGIAEDTFYAWMKKPEFSESIKKARLADKTRSIKLITRAGVTKWQAAAWKLERGYPEEFALRARIEHTGRGGGPIRTSRSYDFRNVPDDALEKKAFRDRQAPGKKKE